jgi:hypothetical protein
MMLKAIYFGLFSISLFFCAYIKPKHLKNEFHFHLLVKRMKRNSYCVGPHHRAHPHTPTTERKYLNTFFFSGFLWQILHHD